MTTNSLARYQVDSRWKIVSADTEFCRLFRSAESGLIGRDVRDLLRKDFRLDFRRYVARALVGVGDLDATFPMIAPCGEEVWVGHALEPMTAEGMLSGFKAQVKAKTVARRVARAWWEWRGAAPRCVWDAEVDQLAAAN